MEAIIRTAKSHDMVISVPRVKIERLSGLCGKQTSTIKKCLVLESRAVFKAQDLLDKCYDEGRVPLFLVLDGVTDTEISGNCSFCGCFGWMALLFHEVAPPLMPLP